jgi:hypothetical protein
MDSFRKLDVDLPRQPLVNERPFMIAGWVLALVILFAIALGYWKSHTESGPHVQKEALKSQW